MSVKSKPIISKNIHDFIEHGSIAMATHDQFMKIKWCNNAFIDMFNNDDELVGKTLFDLCPREVDRVSRFVRKFRDGTSATVSTSLNMKIGKNASRYIVINSEKFLRTDGTIDEIVSYFRDDTKRLIREDRVKTALESSSQISKHRGLFVSKVVHELRSPITALVMSVGINSEAMPHAMSLARQIKNMTYATKFEMGEFIVPIEEPTCLQDILKTSISSSKMGIVKDIDAMVHTVITVDGVHASENVYLLLDETLVSTVLSELIRNCFELKDVLVKVSVNFNTKTQISTFKVADNGSGMEMAWVLRIFQDFWGGHVKKEPDNIIDSMKHDKYGLGIGLNVCYNIVQCMDSMLDVQTSSNGTAFSFDIASSICNKDDYLPPVTGQPDVLYNWSETNLRDDMRIDRALTADRTIEEDEEEEVKTTIEIKHRIGILDKFKRYISTKPEKNHDEIEDDSVNDKLSIENGPISSSKSNNTGSKQNSRIISKHESKHNSSKQASNNTSVHQESNLNSLIKKVPIGSGKTKSIKVSENVYRIPDKRARSEKSRDSKESSLKGHSICTGDGFQPHILIVDDHSVINRITGRMLVKMGCTYDSASNGALAVEKVKAHHEYYYDLILMDLRMPLMSGMEATKVILSDLKLSIPIVAFTAEDSITVFKEALDCGIIGFLHKPATQTDIEYVIDKYSRHI